MPLAASQNQPSSDEGCGYDGKRSCSSLSWWGEAVWTWGLGDHHLAHLTMRHPQAAPTEYTLTQMLLQSESLNYTARRPGIAARDRSNERSHSTDVWKWSLYQRFNILTITLPSHAIRQNGLVVATMITKHKYIYIFHETNMAMN